MGYMMRKKIIGVLLFLCFTSIGVCWWAWHDFKDFAANSVPIFAYHCVQRSDNIYVTAPEELDKQMKYMHSLGYKAITMKEYSKARSTNTKLHKTMILTFDDGYKDNAQNAAPVLQRYGYVGNVFIAVKYMGTPHYLNWQDVGILKDYGWEVGSHTYNHIKLMEASTDTIRKELTQSKYVLEHGPVPIRVTAFCYPYGSASPTLTALVKEAGYTSALTAEVGTDSPTTPVYELKRIGVFNGGGNLEIFKRNFKEALVVGWLEDKGWAIGPYWFKWRSQKMSSWKDFSICHFLQYLCKILS